MLRTLHSQSFRSYSSRCPSCAIKNYKFTSLQFRSISQSKKVRIRQIELPRKNLNRYFAYSTSRTIEQVPHHSNHNKTHRTLSILRAIALLSAAGAVLWTTSESFRHTLIAIKRCGSIGVVAAQCIVDYSNVMNKPYESKNAYEQAMSECHTRCAQKTYRAMRRNGGIYIKLGQHLSAMIYLLPTEWCIAMIPLQDQCPESSFGDLKKLIEEDIGMSMDQMFIEFDQTPIGVASLAQVHRARLRENNQEVAIKVQHPFVEEFANIDMKAVTILFRWIKWVFPDFQFTWLSEEMNRSIPVELDFRLEAANANQNQQNFNNIESSLKIPDVQWAHKRVMSMEYIYGSRIDNLEYLEKYDIDRNLVSQQLSHIFSNMIFVHGFFHADPHPGNLLIRKKPLTSKSPFNFEIVLLDHGLYRTLETDFRFNYAHLWLALIDGFKEEEMHKYVRLVANIREDEDRPWDRLFVSALTGRAFDAISAGISNVPQTAEELQAIKSATKDGLMYDIMILLARVPKILLLLFKTNDLTRSLDASLKTTHGYGRTFVIMARYCIKAINEEAHIRLRTLSHTRGIFSWEFLRIIFVDELRLWLIDWKFALYERVSDVLASLKKIRLEKYRLIDL